MYKFTENDKFYNVLVTYPKYEFLFYDDSVYYQNRKNNNDNSNTPSGHVNLYELNVNRSSGLIYPFVSKDGTLHAFSTVSTNDFNDFAYGDEIVGTYPLTSTIAHNYYAEGTARLTVDALQNTINFYRPLSEHFIYGTKFSNDALSLISVPSIFYGSNIKKGSVELEFYFTGSLIGKAEDTKRNGELITTTGSAVGDTVGVVLYNEGFIILTGAVNMTNNAGHTDQYVGTDSTRSKWIYFGNYDQNADNSAFKVKYQGTSKTPTLTLLAHAPKINLNYSNNPTHITYGQTQTLNTGSKAYIENPKMAIKNIVKSSHSDYSASFERITYISKIGVFDDKKRLIGVAKMATPIKKTQDRDYTFKLKLDV